MAKSSTNTIQSRNAFIKIAVCHSKYGILCNIYNSDHYLSQMLNQQLNYTIGMLYKKAN